MPSSQTFLMVFSDLDGTLLDHDTYSFEAARPALDRLKRHEIPLILTTSKTYAEVQDLQTDLKIDWPCIVENGSAIFMGTSDFAKRLSKEETEIFGQDYQNICSFINQLPNKLRANLCGFADMTDQDVADVTGLPKEQAAKAKNRMASEPFLWKGTPDELESLRKIIDAQGLGLLEGGRFYHLLSRVDKKNAMDCLIARVRTTYGADYKYHSCALGDGPNDLQMIQGADTGIVIANPKGKTLNIEKKDAHSIVYSAKIGPAGWNETMNNLLDRLNFD